MIIFDHQSVLLDIEKHVASVSVPSKRANLSWNRVRFLFLNIPLGDSYAVLAAFESLISFYMFNKFTKMTTCIEMSVFHEMKNYTICAQKKSNGEGTVPDLILKLGKKELVLNRQNAHAFQQALKKAMNWISPVPHWDGNKIEEPYMV